MAKADDEQVTMTKGELEAMLADRDKRSKMTDEEKQIRAIVREEVGSTLDEKLSAFFDLGENGEGGNNDGGGAQETFLTKLAKAITTTA